MVKQARVAREMGGTQERMTSREKVNDWEADWRADPIGQDRCRIAAIVRIFDPSRAQIEHHDGTRNSHTMRLLVLTLLVATQAFFMPKRAPCGFTATNLVPHGIDWT